MIVRDVETADIPLLTEIHERQGIDYQMPNLASPLFLVKKIAVSGTLSAAFVLKLRAEGMLLIDGGTPEERMLALCELQREALAEAHAKGIDDVDIAVPDSLGFGKRLNQLNWVPSRDGWTVWTQATEAYGGVPFVTR